MIKFYEGQKFGNKLGTRINIIEVDGLYVHTECYNIKDIVYKTKGCHINKLLEEHLIEFGFEEIK